MYQIQNFKFPKNFAWGVTDADIQVIGEKHTLKHENSELTSWGAYSKIPGKTFQGQTPMEGIDRYNRWKEDIEIMKKLGIKHYRTSVSMSRVMTKDKKPNMKAIEWYRTYFKALQKAGITIYATIYHWELPEYLASKGGWKNRETTDYLVEHAKIVHTYLGEYVYEYYILNEPFQATFESYHNGWQSPGEKNLKGALAAVHYMLLAQGMVYHALKKMDPKIRLSTVYNPTITYAASSSKEDIEAAALGFSYQTRIFTDPLYLGTYPENLMKLVKDKMPEIKPGDMEIIKVGAGLETFGVNFYRGKVMRYNKKAELQFEEIRYPQGIKNGLGWPVYVGPTYPEGLYELLKKLYDMYGSYGMKALVISENGTCWADERDETGLIRDDFRIWYIQEHIKQVAKAILAGVPVNGYFVWTLMDNFEWELAYNPDSSFGLVYIDREHDLQRVTRSSFYWYQKVIEKNEII